MTEHTAQSICGHICDTMFKVGEGLTDNQRASLSACLMVWLPAFAAQEHAEFVKKYTDECISFDAQSRIMESIKKDRDSFKIMWHRAEEQRDQVIRDLSLQIFAYSIVKDNCNELLAELRYLMQQFDGENWNCDRCGNSEPTSICDSAYHLRDFLKQFDEKRSGL